MQSCDVPASYDVIDSLQAATGVQLSTTIEEGMQKFVAWYKEYYNA